MAVFPIVCFILSVICIDIIQTLSFGEVYQRDVQKNIRYSSGIFRNFRNSESPEAAQITLAPRDHKVRAKGSVSFFCSATGNPEPVIHWMKDGWRMASNLKHHMTIDMANGSVLRIEIKSEYHNATYDCVADNGIGEPVRASATLQVYSDWQVPSGFPFITDSPTLTAVEKGRDAVMICRATGRPDPTITWLKDYRPLDLTEPRLKLLKTGSLQISNSTKSDEGKYECVAENESGLVYSYYGSLYVKVRYRPPRFTIRPEDVEVKPGAPVNITCAASGHPKPYVTWRLGGANIPPEAPIINAAVLMLKYVPESANYTCIAESDLGSIEATAQVKLKDREELCSGEEITLRCGQEQVLLMQSAHYGHMAIGRCLRDDLGYNGCSTDVLHTLDARCSGRNACHIYVDPNIFEEYTSNCPLEPENYLQLSYTCVNAEHDEEEEETGSILDDLITTLLDFFNMGNPGNNSSEYRDVLE